MLSRKDNIDGSDRRCLRASVFVALLALSIAQAIAIAASEKKLVSLAPSNTELLYDIGAQGEILAVCTNCDYPEEAKKIERAGTFTSANLERLARIKPDVVLLVSGQEQLAGLLSHNNFHVQVLENTKLSDISANVRTLGSIAGRSVQADKLANALDGSVTRLKKLVAVDPKQPKLFYCVWPQPLLTVGKSSFLNDVITACGGVNIAGSTNTAYPNFSAERLLIDQPDLIVLPAEAQGTQLLTRPPWTSLKAVKEKRYFYLPQGAKDGLARPTVRIVDGLYWLSERLHPELAKQLADWHAAAVKQTHTDAPVPNGSPRS